MLRFSCLARLVPVRRNRMPLALAALALTAAISAHAQYGEAPKTNVLDSSALHPPPGVRVAIIEFMDLECPVCASTNPTIEAAAAKYKIPLVRHDFLIPNHAWSPIAALDARWFDTKSKALGDAYRDQVFINQPSFYNNPQLLRQFTDKFAQSHGVAMPFAMDPQGKLAADLKADNGLGTRTGIDHTPTVFIVAAPNTKGPPWVEVTRPQSDLYSTIDQVLANTPAVKAAPVKAAAKTPAKKPAPKPAS
jgi:protein-disulfide isomerase